MNEEIDEGEFYHQDFTTASEWEIFIARMEEIIHDWEKQDSKKEGDLTGDWVIRLERIQFADVEFNFAAYKNMSGVNEIVQEAGESSDEVSDENIALSCLHDSKYDFVPFNGKDTTSLENSIQYWYGLQHFIILSPSHNMGINNESQIKILLSSVNIVLSNTGCALPIFVQIREKWQRCFLGVYENNGISSNFEMVHLKKGPQHCKYLTGLLDLFKTKISSPLPLDIVTLSVQLSYHLNNWMSSSWSQDFHDENILNISSMSKLRFGVSFDPISELVLNTTWLELPEQLVVDSENYSDFDPMQAPNWSAMVTMVGFPATMLSECLTEFYNLLSVNSSLEDILGDLISSNTDSSNPLDLLTESKIPTITSVIKKAAGQTRRKISKTNAPITEDTLVTILYYLFPDAVEDSKNPYNQTSSKETSCESSFGPVSILKNILFDLRLSVFFESHWNCYRTSKNIRLK